MRFFYQNFYWGIRDTCKRGLWKLATLNIEAPIEEPGGGSFTGTLERKMKGGSGNRGPLIQLILVPFLWIQTMLGD